jgi:hypothetical protein
MPSVARSRQLVEPYTFFLDRSLGGAIVVQLVREACAEGEQVVAHDDLFPQDTPDEDWLVDVGQRGWVVLAKDAKIRTNANEREAVLSARVALFSLGNGSASGREMGATFVAALPQIRRSLRRSKELSGCCTKTVRNSLDPVMCGPNAHANSARAVVLTRWTRRSRSSLSGEAAAVEPRRALRGRAHRLETRARGGPPAASCTLDLAGLMSR